MRMRANVVIAKGHTYNNTHTCMFVSEEFLVVI